MSMHLVITGGTGALGSAVVASALAGGHACSIPVMNERELARFPFAQHASVTIVKGVNLTDEGAVESFYQSAVSARGVLHASVHIAGGFSMSKVAETSKEQFVAQMQQNALTAFLCCREAVRAMMKNGGPVAGVRGRIVNVAARPALEPRMGAGMVPYTASKAAVAALTQALAEEVAGDGILVNAVVPSIMDTPANRAAMPGADHSKWPSVDGVAEAIMGLVSPTNTVTRGALVTVYGRS
jgi:NAD(P)-dependent dehydrogenase (short-subunit alcohol dehydrogenase family)